MNTSDHHRGLANNDEELEPLKTRNPSFFVDWQTRRPLDRINFVLGVFSLVIGVPSLVGIIWKNFEITSVASLFIVQNSFILLVFAFLFFRERHLRTTIENKLTSDTKHFANVFSQLTNKFHNINHEKRDLMNRVNCAPRDLPPQETARVLSSFCDEIQDMFQTMFAREDIRFHVTIKGIVESDDRTNHKVATLARDKEMRSHKSYMINDSKLHLVYGNTAFERLLKSEVTDFCDDNLYARSGYENTSQNWKDRYNATLVVPIRRNHIENNIENGDVFELVGFIGIDCIKSPGAGLVFCGKNGKARLELKDILLGYADSVYGILKRGATYSGPDTASPGNYRIDRRNLSFVKSVHDAYRRKDIPANSRSEAPLPGTDSQALQA